ncbi:MAG: PKD domain-containing protein [Pirellulaceae bacterium]
MLRKTLISVLSAVLLALVPTAVEAGNDVSMRAKETVTAVELDHGDRLHFRLKNGRDVELTVSDSGAAIVETVEPGGIVYRFWCRLRIDGQPVVLERFVCSQQCFYEPYVIDGLRIWPDTVKKVFDLIPVRYPRQGNLQCVPRKDVRLAVQDATLRICPETIQPWIERDENSLDVGECYNGDDCYLGPYLGKACHVGMDINHPSGSRLYAPISFDTQAYFNSLKMGHNNNRWRGIRRWKNGDVWAVQTHHLIELMTPQHEPLKAGAFYATTAGVRVGSHEHTHFEFKVARRRPPASSVGSENAGSIDWPVDFDDTTVPDGDPDVLHLDPWIVFWQMFEDRKSRRGETRAAMSPLAPAETGQAVEFRAEGSRPGAGAENLTCYWTFGDGGFAIGPVVKHVFARPGMYPVTLTVDDGMARARQTQHIAVGGKPLSDAVLALAAPGEPSLRPRPARVTDTYGAPIRDLPHTLQFVARPSRPRPRPRLVEVRDLGGATGLQPPEARVLEPDCSWLQIKNTTRNGDHVLRVGVDATNQTPGRYMALVEVHSPTALNSPQPLRVEMFVPNDEPAPDAVIDDRDPGCFATPYFWVGHRFCRTPEKRRGHAGFYLTNGGRAAEGEFVRFTPDLAAGEYVVSLSPETPFRPETSFDVRVRHRDGRTTVRMRPNRSRHVGQFQFAEGTDGHVEILAKESHGLVMADAVVFEPVN